MYRSIGFAFLVLTSTLFWMEWCLAGDSVSHGRYAQVLCKWIDHDGASGIGNGGDITESIVALSALEVGPKKGWQVNRPVSDADVAAIVKSMIMATKAGKLPCTPERGVDLVAATSIELGLSGRDVYLVAFPVLGWSWSPFLPRSGGTVRGGTLPTVEEKTESDVTSASQ